MRAARRAVQVAFSKHVSLSSRQKAKLTVKSRRNLVDHDYWSSRLVREQRSGCV